jgi:hypothetical protein
MRPILSFPRRLVASVEQRGIHLCLGAARDDDAGDDRKSE